MLTLGASLKSVASQARSCSAGALPYIIALDRDTKSVVISIRGTVTLADLATDMMAEPKPMDEWLPDSMAQVGSELCLGCSMLARVGCSLLAQVACSANCSCVVSHGLKEPSVQV